MADDDQKAPWRSQKLWAAVLGIALLITLAALRSIELDAIHVVGIVMALILGRAWEGAAAAKS